MINYNEDQNSINQPVSPEKKANYNRFKKLSEDLSKNLYSNRSDII